MTGDGTAWASSTKGRWYRKLPWRPARAGDIVLIKGYSGRSNGKVARVERVEEKYYGSGSDGAVRIGNADLVYNRESRFDQLEVASSCTNPNCLDCCDAGHVWGPECPKPAFTAGTDSNTKKGGNTNTVRYTAGYAWHPAFRGSVIFPTGSRVPGERRVCVVTDVIGETVSYVSFEDLSIAGTCTNRSSSHYSLDPDPGYGEYDGPDDAVIAGILAGGATTLPNNRYRATAWRKAQVGDIVLDNSYDQVCVVTRHRTLEEHGYGQHSYHAETDSEVVTIAVHNNLSDTKERWNWEDSFKVLVPDHDGEYVGPDHSTINNNATGGINMDAQPLIIKTPKVIESIQGKLDEKKQAWDEAEAKRVADAENAGKVFAAFAKANPAFVQDCVEYRYRVRFDQHADVKAVQTWFEAAGYSSTLDSFSKKADVAPAAEFPGDATLEKMIRTLTMADNETVEVFPTDAIYSLL